MITRDQAIVAGSRSHTEVHEEGHPPPGRGVHSFTWRVNGAAKTWNRSQAFRLPVKYGFHGPYSAITEETASKWHLASECPLA